MIGPITRETQSNDFRGVYALDLCNNIVIYMMCMLSLTSCVKSVCCLKLKVKTATSTDPSYTISDYSYHGYSMVFNYLKRVLNQSVA